MRVISYSGPVRVAAGRLVTILALGASIAACGTADTPAGTVDDPLRKLTAVAAGTPLGAADATAAPAADAPTAASASLDAAPSEAAPMSMDAMATQLAGEGDGAIPPLPTDALGGVDVAGGGEGLSPAAAETMSAEKRATADVKAGIANVDALVAQQPPLATFTPAPKPAALRGELLFVRGGEFYVAEADGQSTRKLELENRQMPSVWSPPDDPGRAWQSPDRRRVAFLAGNDAGVWVMDTDGDNGRQLHANTLPDEMHTVRLGSAEMEVKLRPGSDYTLVLTPGGTTPMGVLVDNNEYHKRGEARVRFVHAARGLADTVVIPIFNSEAINRAAYGRTNGESAFDVGPLQLDLRAQGGGSVGSFPDLQLADKEVKTIFVYGDEGALKVSAVAYEAGTRPTAGKARVRVFNAGTAPVDLVVDGQPTAVRGLGEGTLSPYIEVQGTLGEGELEDMRIDIYGLRAGESPIAWSPDGERLTFVSAETGQRDLWVTTVDGDARQLTNDVSREINPQWSPDSRHLLWLTEDEMNQTVRLVVQPAASGDAVVVDTAPIRQAEQLAADKPLSFGLALGWIDADTVYLTPRIQQQERGIWTYDIASRQLRPLFRGAIDGVTWSAAAEAFAFHTPDTGAISTVDTAGKVSPIVAANGYFPQWSPDGKTIVYGEGASTDGTGWRMMSVGRDGKGGRALTDKLPAMQSSPPVPGPNFKLAWSKDGRMVLFSRVGRDYGLKDRVGVVGSLPSAGDDIENLYAVPLAGGAPTQLSDLTKAFYLNDLTPSNDGATLAFIGFTYLDRTQRLFTMPSGGGKPISIDTPVRWFTWVP